MKNFSGSGFDNKAEGFNEPTLLPTDEGVRRVWQRANREWWETTPMRYDWREEIAADSTAEDYFDEIDRRFLSSASKYMPWRFIPFDPIIPFDDLADKDVLEVGVGQGTHAQLIAPYCRSYTGIDLTSRAVEATSRRLEARSVAGRILQMDAENMAFAEDSFDYIWSWGVIHHSADTRKVLEEMRRVTRLGATCTVMVYHRSWWCFYLCGILRRWFQESFRGHKSLHQIAQHATDGAIARYYTIREWRQVAGEFFDVDEVKIYGLKPEILPLPHGKLKSSIEALIPDSVARLLTNRFRMGSFLVATLRRT